MKTLALCGAPNCGKTTLFNMLTGQMQRTGNWSGVTVDCAAGYIQEKFVPKACKTPLRLIDMPGACSLQPYSAEEAVTLHQLQGNPPDAVICVVNACAPAQGLYLALQLMALGIPLVIALNMMDALAAQHGRMDVMHLAACLHVPVVAVSARSGQNVPALIQQALCLSPAPILVPFEPDAPCSRRAALATRRYQLIDQALQRCFQPGKTASGTHTQRIDTLVLHRWFSWPILLFVLLFVFFCAFGTPGRTLADDFSDLLTYAIQCADTLLHRAHAPALLRSLLTQGAFRGVAAALTFLPTLLLLFLLTALLEDSGYMARAAFMLDAPLRHLGLSGRSFFPLMTGFGCTVPAVMATRLLPDQRSRLLSSLLVSYIPCGAKAPVFLYLAALAFPGKCSLGMLFAYLLGPLCMALLSWPLRRLYNTAPVPLIMELPAYHLPTLRGVWRVMREKTCDFLSRAFTVVFFTALLIWFLQYFTPALTPAQAIEKSMLYRLSALLLPIFQPLGFASPQLLAALIAGLMAKENILSVLLLFSPIQALFPTQASAVSFLTFTALYAPCFAACAVLARECKSRRRMLFAVLLQTAVAWLAAFVVYRLFS